MNVKTRDLKFHLFIHVQREIAGRQCIQSNLIQPIQFAWNWGGDLDKQHFLEYVCYVSLFEMGIELGQENILYYGCEAGNEIAKDIIE